MIDATNGRGFEESDDMGIPVYSEKDMKCDCCEGVNCGDAVIVFVVLVVSIVHGCLF